jgi:hypothetical protein
MQKRCRPERFMMSNYESRKPSYKWTRAWSAWIFDQARVWAYLVAKRLVPGWHNASHLDFLLDLLPAMFKRQGNPNLDLTPSVSFTPRKRIKLGNKSKKVGHHCDIRDTRTLDPSHPLYNSRKNCVLCWHLAKRELKVRTFCSVEACDAFLS